MLSFDIFSMGEKLRYAQLPLVTLLFHAKFCLSRTGSTLWPLKSQQFDSLIEMIFYELWVETEHNAANQPTLF